MTLAKFQSMLLDQLTESRKNPGDKVPLTFLPGELKTKLDTVNREFFSTLDAEYEILKRQNLVWHVWYSDIETKTDLPIFVVPDWDRFLAAIDAFTSSYQDGGYCGNCKN
jgi:hypothetical protein